MFARWYALFLGFLLIVLGIAGLVASRAVTVGRGGLITTSIVFLIIALAGLWMGFRVTDNLSLRWFSGIVGGVLFLWGIIQLAAAPGASMLSVATAVASVGGFLVLLGSLGLAAAVLPTVWLQERAPAMP